MKKRLLSAFLALAMVLTLLPAMALPAFAVDYGAIIQYTPQSRGSYGTPSKPFYQVDATHDISETVTRFTGGNDGTNREYGHWYWLDNKTDPQNPVYCEVTEGIIAGNSGTGKWYASPSDFTKTATDGKQSLRSTSFTLLGNTSLSMNSGVWTSNSLNVDMEGTGTLTVPDTLTNLTVTSKYKLSPTGTVSVPTIDRSDFTSVVKSGVTITATNVNLGTISLTGRGNNVTLTDCVAGPIIMDGSTFTTATALAPNTFTGQRLKITGGTVNTSISMTGDGNNLEMANVAANAATVSMLGAGNIRTSGTTAVSSITSGARTKSLAYPDISVSGGYVGTITQTAVTDNKDKIIVTVSGSNTTVGTGGITVLNGDVTLSSSKVQGGVVVNAGSLRVDGSGVGVANNLTLGATDKTTLTMSATKSTFGGVVTANGNNVIINSWVGTRFADGGNNYGVLSLGTYADKKITGGTFSGAGSVLDTFVSTACLPWLDTSKLQFVVTTDAVNNVYDLYAKDELARAISDIGTANAVQTWGITVLGQGGGTPHFIVLQNGDIEWAKIKYNTTTGMILPNRINNVSIAKWIAVDNAHTSLDSGVSVNVPYQGSDLVLDATGVTPEVNRITKVTVASNPSAPVQNPNVTATLNGNNIQISGAVTEGTASIASFTLNLETDVVDKDGNYVILSGVVVDYETGTRKVSFNQIQPSSVTAKGVIVQNGELVLNHGTGARYTVSASLNVSASKLGVATEGLVPMVATVGGKLSSWTKDQKDALIDLLTGTGTSFTYGNNPAMQQAINAAQATITSNSSVDGWINTAKNNIWRQGFKSPNTVKNGTNGFAMVGTVELTPNNGQYSAQSDIGKAIASAFQKAYLVPYLAVNVTDYSPDGTMTATLVPSYRVDVSGSTYDADMAYTVQQGRPLNLTGDMYASAAADQVKVTFNLGTKFDNKVMHQDGKYAYTGAANVWTLFHASTGGTLGTIEINNIPGYITFDGTAANAIANRNPALPTYAYDSLQAAIDDSVRGKTVVNTDSVADLAGETFDTIVIDGKYTGSCAINMTGIARKVRVVANGQQDVTCNSKNVEVQTAGAFRYILSMKQDNVASGTVAVAVNVTGSGTASASVSTAKPGDTVTITTIPTAGQAVSSISAKTNSGANVSVTSTGVANQYRFTVPQNATSVTVTASFGVATAANLTITSSNYGLAATSSTQVYAGQEVTITTTPYTGYRATGVTVTTNAGTMTATRTADNVYKFTVPANATYVTVTPTFAADTGLPFVDVPANDFYLDAVKFVYEKGLMNGITATTFGGSRTITRGQIVTILYRLSGSPAASNTSSFQDVPADEYYAPAITWAASNAIVNGRNSTSFAPNDAITRQELAAILYRYTSFRGLTNNKLANLSGYTDQGQVDGYAVTPMQWCVGNGIINGTSNTTLTPRGTAQRYQAAIMLMRYCQAFLNM